MKRLFSLFAAAVMAMGLFTSCENNEPQDYETVLLPHFVQLYKHTADKSDGIEFGYGYLQFKCASSSATNGVSEMQFAAVGKVSGINKITKVPDSGWQDLVIEAHENNGYLIRYHMRGTNGWLYRRLYIKEYILLGGADWYGKIQLDARDWDPFAE